MKKYLNIKSTYKELFLIFSVSIALYIVFNIVTDTSIVINKFIMMFFSLILFTSSSLLMLKVLKVGTFDKYLFIVSLSFSVVFWAYVLDYVHIIK